MRLLLLLLALPACALPRSRSTLEADLCVYGATSAGVIAAVQAARQGNTVVLLEPTSHLGGLSSSGLGATDIGNKGAVGGMAREFYRRIRDHYADPDAWVHERPEEFGGRGHREGEDAAWTFEPKVARATFAAMLEEVGVTVHFGERLDRQSGLEVKARRVVGLRTETGLVVRARCWIDATYEGDLMACAGVRYAVGREANARYGETLNGVQVAMSEHHQFVVPVDPYAVPGDPESGLLPGIGSGPGVEGEGDHRVQAYCFRICATDVPGNRIPWPRPEDYDERRYELLFRNFEAGDGRIPWHPVWMPNRKTDSNNNFAVSTDHIGFNYGYPEAGYREREAIVAEHLSWTQGLLWSLANHPRVPESVREHFTRFGLCRDEFVATGHWPPMLYVREARRMVGDVVMTERHCRGLLTVDDAVGMGAYGMDSHNVQRYVAADGTVRNEGDVQVHGFSPYPVSYRSIVPARGQCENLLVPVCVSASHIAYGSIRMEPVFMVLGQSAAIAAGIALERGMPVQDVPYAALRERLQAAGQVLEWRGEQRKLVGIEAASLAGVVVDDEQAALSGVWTRSTSQRPFVEFGYRHDGNAGKGAFEAVFEFEVPAAGRYEVRIAWTPHDNRARRVPVQVRHAEGVADVELDQTEAPPIDGVWRSLGRFRFAERGSVVVSNAGTEGYVIVDAVQVLPVQ